MFLKLYNTGFDEIIITFRDQNGRPLEMEDKLIWHCLLINRNKVLFCRTKNGEIFKKKTIIEYYYKAGINASKKVIHKAAEATGQFLGN